MDRKTFVIFGGYGNIGFELAKRLADKGFSLLLCARSEYKLALVADVLDANYCCADVSDPEQILDCMKAAKEQFSRIDGVAFCAGPALKSPSRLTMKKTLACIRYSADAMQEEGGKIVLALCDKPDADMKSLIKSATSLYKQRNVSVEAILPGQPEEIVSSMESFLASDSDCPPGNDFKTNQCCEK